MAAYMLGWPYSFNKLLWKDTVKCNTCRWQREASCRYDGLKEQAEGRASCSQEWHEWKTSFKEISSRCRRYLREDLRKEDLEVIDKLNRELYKKGIICSTVVKYRSAWPVKEMLLPGVTADVIRYCGDFDWRPIGLGRECHSSSC